MNADKVTELLKQAASAVDAAQIPQDLRASAFEGALNLLTDRKLLSSTGTVDDGSVSKTRQEDGSEDGLDPDAVLEKIAGRFNIDRDDVEHVFRVVDGRLDLDVPASRLDSSTAGAARQITLLIAAGRQAAELDKTSTGMEDVRRICDEYGKYDVTNFSKHVKGLKDEMRITDDGVRVNRHGFEQAAMLVQQLAGGADA